MINRTPTSNELLRSKKGGWGCSIIKTFWPNELDDLWSKKICRPKMIAWSGATFLLRWSWNSFDLFNILKIQNLTCIHCGSLAHHFIPFATVYLLCFRNIFSLVNGLYHPVSRGRIAPIASTVLNTDERHLSAKLLFQFNFCFIKFY